jgi:LemA protein
VDGSLSVELVMWIVVATVAVIAALALLLWHSYRSLMSSRQTVDESWRGIAVQLRRRADLVPNLVETVKSYAPDQDRLFEDAAQARSRMTEVVDQGPVAAAAAEKSFQQILGALFAVATKSSGLAASKGFQQLRFELTDTEDKLAASRRFYNANVNTYNILVRSFPANTLAKSIGFTPRQFYDTPDARTTALEI